MLILTRKPGQGFLIGDDIEITVTEISGDKVRIGIDAPKHIKVLRTELSQTVESNQQAAGKADSGSLRALAQGLKLGGGKPGTVPSVVSPHQAKPKPDK